MSLRSVSIFFTIATMAASLLVAQTPTGSISGTVSDATGAQVAGATIRLINTKTLQAQTAGTNVTGSYLFPIVAVGEYTLEAEAAGFKIEKRAGVMLDVNQNGR